MLGLSKEQILQTASQKIQANQDITTIMAEIIVENNQLIEQQVNERIYTRARPRNAPADVL